MGLKLCVAATFLTSRGGMERVVLKIAQEFDAKIHCMYYDPENTFEEFKGMDIEAAGRLSSLKKGRRAATGIEAGAHFFSLKLKDYDVINCHSTPSEWVRNKNSPVIWYCHSPNREAFDMYGTRMARRGLFGKAVYWASIQAFKKIEYSVVPKIEHIYANSKNTQSRIMQYLGRESELLYPGVDAKRFTCKNFEHFFFYPSRFVPDKDHKYAIDAFSNFLRISKDKDWKLIMAGGLPQGQKDYYDFLQDYAKKCEGKVEFRINIPDSELIDLYSRCYSVLYTPINEDFGLVPLEAMASGKPCIAKNEGGMKETIKDGKDGFLVNDSLEMAKKMVQLAQNQDICEMMGKEGKKKVRKEFTWEKFLKRFGEKAEEIAGRQSKI